jgi:MYXO-CTERM domain-containing protein
MKKILLLAALLATATSMFGQGVVLFNTRVGTSPNFTVNAPITNAATGAPIDGTVSPQFRAALYGAAGAGQAESSLVMMTNPDNGQAAVSFRSGAAAGHVLVGSDGKRGLAGLGFSSAVTVQVRAWGGGYATYEEAVLAGAPIGKSNLLTLTTTVNSTDPDIPALAGLQGFAVVVPEPSSIALGLLGLGALALIRRRK